MKRVSKIIFIFLLFSLLLIFSSCTEQKSNNSKKRKFDIIDGKIYIDIDENMSSKISEGLRLMEKTKDSIVVCALARVNIYVDYSKMDDYMKAIHRYNLKYSYSNEEDKIKDNYYYHLNSYLYDSFNYDFHDDYDYNDDSTDPNEWNFYDQCCNKPFVNLQYWVHSSQDPTMSRTGLDDFYLDYDKIKEISLYDYVIKIEVIEAYEFYDFNGELPVYIKK